MKPYTTSDRLKQIMAARNLKQADIVSMAQPYCKAHDIHLGKSTISQYVSGKTEPGQSKLTILGLALGVSEAWLMGYDVPMEREKAPISAEGNERMAEFIDLFGKLTPDQQAIVIAQIKGILSTQ